MRLRREKIAGACQVAPLPRCGKSTTPRFQTPEEKEEGIAFPVCPDGFPEVPLGHGPTGKGARPLREGFQQVKGRRRIGGTGCREFEPGSPLAAFPR
jgi:hypothetical protein